MGDGGGLGMSMDEAQFHTEVMAQLEQEEILTHEVSPPIPTDQFDFCAVRRSYEPGDPIGYGPTKENAIQDLIDQEQQ
jgi:hypothetical protein